MHLTDDLLPFNCAKAEPRSLPVDTIVIHFISALNWDALTPDGQNLVSEPVFASNNYLRLDNAFFRGRR